LTSEEEISFLKGQIEMLKNVFTVLVATHPLRIGIMGSIIGMSPLTKEEPANAVDRAYMLGMKNVLDDLTDISRVAALARQGGRTLPDVPS
jgi:hypothetical protein